MRLYKLGPRQEVFESGDESIYATSSLAYLPDDHLCSGIKATIHELTAAHISRLILKSF